MHSFTVHLISYVYVIYNFLIKIFVISVSLLNRIIRVCIFVHKSLSSIKYKYHICFSVRYPQIFSNSIVFKIYYNNANNNYHF